MLEAVQVGGCECAETAFRIPVKKETDKGPGAGYTPRSLERSSQITEKIRLFDDSGNDASADGVTAFADGEAETLFHGDRADELDSHLDVVARHAQRIGRFLIVIFKCRFTLSRRGCLRCRICSEGQRCIQGDGHCGRQQRYFKQ